MEEGLCFLVIATCVWVQLGAVWAPTLWLFRAIWNEASLWNIEKKMAYWCQFLTVSGCIMISCCHHSTGIILVTLMMLLATPNHLTT